MVALPHTPDNLLLHGPGFLADGAAVGLLLQHLAQVQSLVLGHASLLAEVLELALVTNWSQEALTA